ncbi:hypothetical protein N8083_02325, partial [Candidatus Pacebacteria bacterium]|nr:hypothetical protein [Candidatus Paceibacterota bacterium]
MEEKKSKKKYVIIGTIATLIVVLALVYWFAQTRESTSYEPVIYSEVFEVPIDPNTEPEKHREVYEKVDKFVGFDVLFPAQVPQGHKLIEVRSSAQSPADPISGFIDVGGFSASYVT